MDTVFILQSNFFDSYTFLNFFKVLFYCLVIAFYKSKGIVNLMGYPCGKLSKGSKLFLFYQE